MLSRTRLLALGALLSFVSCATTGRELSEAAAAINATATRGDVLLSGGDVIEVTFPNKDEWNSTIGVRPDGKASFPFLDDVQVAGLTLGQLDKTLTESYDEILEAPELTLNVTAWGSREVVVMGMVETPGPVVMSSPHMTLIEAIGRAGGPRRRIALMQQVVLVRWLPEDGLRKAWKIDARLENWHNSTPVLLQPHDLVYIPNKPVDDVNIWIDQYIRQMIPIPQLIPGSI